jgi:hypothetical protein
MKFALLSASQIGILVLALLCSQHSVGVSNVGDASKLTLSAASPSGDANVQIQTEVGRDFPNRARVLWISNFEIRVGSTVIHVPRSAYADLVDPRQVRVEFKGTAGSVNIDGGDGEEAYLVRIFFDRNSVNRRTLSSALIPGRPTEETRYLLQVMKDE